MTKLAVLHRRAATGNATNVAALTCATGRHDLDHLQWPTGRTPCETDGIQPMLRVGFPNPTQWGINPTPSHVVTAPKRRATVVLSPGENVRRDLRRRMGMEISPTELTLGDLLA